MEITGPVLRIVPGLQATAVLGRAVKIVPKMRPKKPMKPLKQSKRMIKGFVDITIGTALIKPTSQLVNTF